MYKIKITARAKRELKKISKQGKESLELVFEELKEYPNLGKPLSRNLSGKFSYRTGMFRIVYKINKKDEIVTIITAGHRSEVYN